MVTHAVSVERSSASAARIPPLRSAASSWLAFSEMTSLEDETLDALARRFPYMQTKKLAIIGR